MCVSKTNSEKKGKTFQPCRHFGRWTEVQHALLRANQNSSQRVGTRLRRRATQRPDLPYFYFPHRNHFILATLFCFTATNSAFPTHLKGLRHNDGGKNGHFSCMLTEEWSFFIFFLHSYRLKHFLACTFNPIKLTLSTKILFWFSLKDLHTLVLCTQCENVLLLLLF